MKILVISNMYPSPEAPHYGIFVKNIIEELQNRGIKTDKIVCYKKNSKVSKLISYFTFYFKILIKGFFIRYDCVYAHYASHTALPLLILLKLKPYLKIIMNVHGNDIVPEDQRDEKYIPLVRKILNRSCYIISPSKYFEKVLRNEYNINKSKIFVSPSGGVNLNTFKSKHIKEKDNFVVGFVSRIEINKGWDVFLDAIKVLINKKMNIKFILIGQGNEYDKLIKKIRDYDLEKNKSLELYPFLDQKDLVDMYNKMDVFCFPTRRKSESLGLVGLEAMACGAIVIGSNCFGPSSYLIDGVNGFVFNPKDSNELRGKIMDVYKMSIEDRKRISIMAIETAKEYDSNLVQQELGDFFERHF